jgi:ribosome-binding protein aMBF1 (putative translation factor)
MPPATPAPDSQESKGTARAIVTTVVTIYGRLESSRAGRSSVYVVLDSEQVRILREEKGLSKRDLAAAASVSETTLRRVEREEPVYFRTGRKVAKALGVEPSPSLGRLLTRA